MSLSSFFVDTHDLWRILDEV